MAPASDIILKPVWPNAGVTAWYRRQLRRMVAQMNASVVYWLEASYKANEPVMAQDELPADALWKAMRKLRRRWQKNFDEAGPKLAKLFAERTRHDHSARMNSVMREAGMTVQFKMTKPMQDIMRATINEQVSLIRSIPQKYFTDIEGLVMRSVREGRNLSGLSQELQARYGVTQRRAAFIAKDQNNKATASMTHARQEDLGIKQAVWLHSHGGKVPRPTHLANNGKRYNVAEGWYDPDADGKGKGRHIHPGQLINCRCVSRSIVPGFT